MANEIAIYLKYANLQMAAESLFALARTAEPGTLSTNMTEATLKLGNNRSSVFTETQAKQFIADKWTVAEHKSNTPTGFSGTLFKNTETGELALSFRSTEFIDDAARDNEATNAREIRKFGWAFGQIADMRNWVNTLYASNQITGTAPLTVTGYSLGGHLAAAFNQLYPTAAQATYTFNGAGIGLLKPGNSLSQVMAGFDSRRAFMGNVDLFTTTVARNFYQDLAGRFNAGTVNSAADIAAKLSEVSLAIAQTQPISASTVRTCTNGVRSFIITPQHQMGSTPNGVTPNGVRSFIITPH